MTDPITDLMIIEDLNPIEVYNKGGIKNVLEKFEKDVRSIITDATTKAGQKNIRSFAYKIAQSRIALDEMGKGLVSDRKKEIGLIDIERRKMRIFMNDLHEEFRRPLTEIEEREEARKDALKQRWNELESMAEYEGELSSQMILGRIEHVIVLSEAAGWDEYSLKVTALRDEVTEVLNKKLAEQRKQEDDRAELERLKEAEVERLQKEREDQIRKEAVEKEQVEKRSLVEEKEDAERRAKYAEERAEKEKSESEERANKAAKAAERKTKAEAKSKSDAIAAENKRRADDEKHKSTIRADVTEALLQGGYVATQDRAEKLFRDIESGLIPHIKITY